MSQNYTQVRNFQVASGQGLDVNVGWLIKGVRVDNSTSVWYVINPQGYVIPPSTLGWTTDLPQSSSAINIQPINYSGQPNYIFTGDVMLVTVFSDPVGIAGGFSAIPNDERSSIFSALPGATLSTGTLSFPAIGARIDNLTGSWYQIGASGILVPPWTTGFTIDILPAVTAVTLTAATPPYGPANSSAGTGITLTLYATKIGNYGGTTATIAASPKLLQSNFNTSGGTGTVTATLPTAAYVGDILVTGFAFGCGIAAPTITPPAGWTSLGTASGSNVGHWLGWKIAAGGETAVTFSLSNNNAALACFAAEYNGFTNGATQTGYTAASNSASATPTASPSLLITFDAYGSNSSVDAGTVSSINSTIRNSIKSSNSTQRAAVALSDQSYINLTAKTGTLVWTGGTALATAVVLGE
jgi:hypothetical protein